MTTKPTSNRRYGLAATSAILLLATTACASPCEDDGLLQDACPGADAADADAEAEGTGATGGAMDGNGDRGEGDGSGDGAESDGDDTRGSAEDGSAGDGPAGDGSAETSADDGSSGDGDPVDDHGEGSDGDPDDDDDGVSDEEDNCPAFANPGQQDGDGDGLGDACDLDAACGSSLAFVPLLSPGATAAGDVDGPCIGCAVEDVDDVVDHDFTTYARMITTVGVLGRTQLRVHDGATTHPAGARVGFVLEGAAGVLAVDLLAGLALTTTMGDEENESAGSGTVLDLDVLTDGSDRALVVMTTSAEFDGVRLDVGGLAGVSDALHVYAACVEGP